MFKISLQVGWGYKVLMRSDFQEWFMWSIKSATVPLLKLGWFNIWGWHGNHAEWSKAIFVPEPMIHLPSFRNLFFWSIIPLQNQEWWGLGEQSWIEVLGKYLALKVLAKREWRCWLILQNCLTNMTWFMSPNFLNPKPPSLLGLKFLSQFTSCIFFSPSSCPH